MNKAADTTTKPSSKPTTYTLGAVALDLLNTTWRITIPVIILAGGGIVADKQFGTAPWLTLTAVVVGFILAGLLVKKQLDAVNRKEPKA